MKKIDYIQFIIIDLFCGAGGTSLGFEMTDNSWQKFRNFLKAQGIKVGKEDKEKFFKMCQVIAGINHDYTAIVSHHANNEHVVHFNEDITKLYGFKMASVLLRTREFMRLIRLVEIYRAFYPEAKIILWASLECTNFSKAKGGMSRNADSRTLANHLFPYIIFLSPDYIMIENVVEFKKWGPLVPKTGRTPEGYEYCKLLYVKPKKKVKLMQPPVESDTADALPIPVVVEESLEPYFTPHWIPCPDTNGIYFHKWRELINEMNYLDQWKELNAADQGAYTSRNRLFGVFAKQNRDRQPIGWPKPTHVKNPAKHPGKKKWMAVKHVLDFQDEGTSIFNRVKRIPKIKQTKEGYYYSVLKPYDKEFKTFGPLPDPLSPKSMQRLYMGSIRHIAGGKDNFLSVYNSGNPEFRNHSTDEPAKALTTSNRLSIVQADFIVNYHHSSVSNDVNEPAPTITTKDKLAKVFISKYNGTNGGKHDNSDSVEGPVGSLSTKERHAKVSATFISTYNSNKPTEKGGGNEGRSIDEPAPTITTGHTPTKVTATFIDQQYSQGQQNRSVEDPLGSITTVPKQKIVQAEFFLDKQYSGEENNQSVEQPAGSIVGNDKHALVKAEKWIMNTQFNNIGHSIESPSPVITADRHHHYIINPSWGGNSGSIDEPCHVVVARQDKAPLYLITCTVGGNVAVPVYEGDCEYTIKLKEFMALYNICDIKMRMLKEMELLPIQGFPIDYFDVARRKGIKVTGTQAKKYIGNAVHPLVPKAIAEEINELLAA